MSPSRSRRPLACSLLLLLYCYWLPPIARTRAAYAPTQQNAPEVRTLAPDQKIERALAGGEAHTYQLALDAGQYLHLVVEQKGIDVVVAGKRVNGENDSEHGERQDRQLLHGEPPRGGRPVGPAT